LIGLSHCCQDGGAVSAWFKLNTLNDSIETLDFVSFNEGVTVGGEDEEGARLSSNFKQ
jgi:hypothetical protein